MKNLNQNFFMLALLVITAALYFKTLWFEFLSYDDFLYITNNNNVLAFDWQAIKNIFLKFEWGHYFPLTMLSYGVQVKLFGLSPMPMQALNVGLHLTNAALVYVFLKALKINHKVAFVASALFALGPIQTESVSWLGTRGGILAAFFALLSMIQYQKHINRPEGNHLILVYVFFILGLLSKSSVVLIPLVFVLQDVYALRKINIQTLIEKVPAFLLSLIFSIIAILAARELGTVDSKNLLTEQNFQWFNRPFIILYSATFYAFKAIFPFQLSALHYNPTEVDGLLPLKFYVQPLAVLFGFTGLAWLIQNKRKFFFFAAFYLVNLLLVINVIPLGGTVASERYAYLPVLGIYSIVALVIHQVYLRYKSLAFGLVLIIFVGFCLLTYQRLEVWRNTHNLFEDVYAKYPNNAHSINAYANTLAFKGELSKALQLQNMAIQKVTNFKYYADRGGVYYLLDSLSLSEIDYTTAIQLAPHESDNFLKRAFVRHKKGNFQGALNDLNFAIQLNQGNRQARELRAEILLFFGDFSKACEDLNFLQKFNSPHIKSLTSKFCRNPSELTNQNLPSFKKVMHPNGKKHLEIINDTLLGDSAQFLITYDTSGNIIEKGAIRNGKYNGRVWWLYPNGAVKIKGYFLDIIPYGNWEEFYPNGNLMAKYSYLGGVKDGIYEYYYPSGKIWTKKNYEHGKLMDVLVLKSEGGKNLDVGSFYQGNGELNIYNIEGDFIEQATYVNGKLTSISKKKTKAY